MASPYVAVERLHLSHVLDNDARIGDLARKNRERFTAFLAEITHQCRGMGVPDSPEMTQAVHLLEQAKDAFGRVLIHGVGKVLGIPFEEAVAIRMNPVPPTDDKPEA
jgi:hypothetical protein